MPDEPNFQFDDEDDDGPRRPTMTDVANLAGVALSSVSRALADHPDVSKKMRRRVLQAAAELGYEPNFLAQSLRTGSTQTIGFIVRDIGNPYFAAIANGAEQHLRQHGFVMLLVNSDGDSDLDADHIHVLRRRRVDGLILNIVSEEHQPTNDAIASLTTPFVLIDREIAGVEASAVLCDHFHGVRAATADLIRHGHRRIGLISGPRSVRPVRERIRGMESAFADASLEVDGSLLRLGSFSSAYAYEQMNALLDQPDPPTAVLSGGVQVTLGAMKALGLRGLRPGVEIGFVALDELDVLDVVQPPVSAVVRDPQRMGREAARLLLATAGGGEPLKVTLPTEYQPRGTPTVRS